MGKISVRSLVISVKKEEFIWDNNGFECFLKVFDQIDIITPVNPKVKCVVQIPYK